MKVPVLHCDGHQETSDEQHVGVFQVLNTDLKRIDSTKSKQPKLVTVTIL